ncbi:hypothetical protein [Roseomonas fluvialis]|uniref:hypothetical protein n=1 Tax=Roseomonas fluvialis TaxID=1750527 RepID=UPI001FCD4C20|nr:hypothetical protein [Roseomonas fluvialis]
MITDLITTVSETTASLTAGEMCRGASIVIGFVVALAAMRWWLQWARWWRGDDLDDVAQWTRRDRRPPWAGRADRDQ